MCRFFCRYSLIYDTNQNLICLGILNSFRYSSAPDNTPYWLCQEVIYTIFVYGCITNQYLLKHWYIYHSWTGDDKTINFHSLHRAKWRIISRYRLPLKCLDVVTKYSQILCEFYWNRSVAVWPKSLYNHKNEIDSIITWSNIIQSKLQMGNTIAQSIITPIRDKRLYLVL